MKSMNKLVSRDHLWPFILVTALFFIWAIPNNLNDILIPQFMKSFELNRLQAGLVQSAFYMGYFILAIPAALVMERFSYRHGLLIGVLLFASGCFLFYPAARLAQYPLFLCALFIIASGLAFLETGANSFISGLGDPQTSEVRLNFSQSFNPIGAISGALVGTIFIFSGVEHSAEKTLELQQAGVYQDYLHQEIMRVIPPYLAMGVLLLIWAFLLWRARFPVEIKQDSSHQVNYSTKRIASLFRRRHFTKGVVAQFFYVGAQVGTWSFLISYVKDYLALSEKQAGMYLTASLVVFCLGRFIATYLMSFMGAQRLMAIFSSANILLMIIAITMPGMLGGIALVASSFFMSLMFPTIFALSVKDLGADAKLGGSFVIMAIIGGAVWTPIMGYIGDTTNSLALAMCLPLISYIYITYYAHSGSHVFSNYGAGLLRD